MKKKRKYKPQVCHWGERRNFKILTLCGKEGDSLSYFNEYGWVTTDKSQVTCTNCIHEMELR